MAFLVCDRTPCEYMQAALDALITNNHKDDCFSIMVRTSIDSRVSFIVPLQYCPFCGTRIDPQWVRNYYRLPGVREA